MGTVNQSQKSELQILIENKLSSIGQVELICFDIFDTVLTRIIGQPSAVFLTLGRNLHKRGIIPVSAESFARARRLAEDRARQVARSGTDITLKQIYEEFGRCYPWGSKMISVLVDAEMREEKTVIRAVPGILDVLVYVRARCKKIVFVSDMYLPTKFLKEQLQAHGVAEAGDEVFVSSDCGCKKGNSGALFQYVLDYLKVSPSNAIHIGNDWMVDYMAARRVGMHALYVHQANLNCYESILERGHWDTGAVTSLYAGASRLARLQIASQYGVDQNLVPVCASVVAPLLFSYALWVLKRAFDLGLRRLYFLAREGEVIHRIAQHWVAQLDIPIKLYYLYVSRQSLNLTLLDVPDAKELQWALTNFENDTLEKALGRLGLSPKDIADDLSAISLNEKRWKTPVTRNLWPHLLDILLSESVREKISEQAKERKSLVEQYLRGVDFFDDVPIGLVDTTGVGSQFRTLNRLRSQAKCASIEGFLMVRIWQPRLDYIDFPRVHGYYCDQYIYQKHYSIPGLTSMLEVFCAADHGTVKKYQPTSRGIEAILVEAENHAARQRYTKQIRQVLDYFVKVISIYPELLDEDADSRSAMIAVYLSFWNNPSLSDAKAWGGYPVEVKNIGTRQAVLAPPLRLRDLLRIEFEDPSATFLGTHTWRTGAEHRSASHIKMLITITRSIKRAIKIVWRVCPSRIKIIILKLKS